MAKKKPARKRANKKKVAAKPRAAPPPKPGANPSALLAMAARLAGGAASPAPATPAPAPRRKTVRKNKKGLDECKKRFPDNTLLLNLSRWEHLTREQRLFLVAYCQAGTNITHAARLAQVSRNVHYDGMQDPSGEYPEAFEAAHSISKDVLEAEAHRRAVVGQRRLVLYRGRPVLDPEGEAHKDPDTGEVVTVRDPQDQYGKEVPFTGWLYEVTPSDQLMTTMLRGAMPGKYGQRVTHEDAREQEVNDLLREAREVMGIRDSDLADAGLVGGA